MFSLGLPFFVILTNIDGICELVNSDPSKAFHSEKVAEAVRETSAIFGVPANHVCPVKNYESKEQCVPAIDIMALCTCQIMVNNANEYLKSEIDHHSGSKEVGEVKATFD